jgi:hypothetical protein
MFCWDDRGFGFQSRWINCMDRACKVLMLGVSNLAKILKIKSAECEITPEPHSDISEIRVSIAILDPFIDKRQISEDWDG